MTEFIQQAIKFSDNVAIVSEGKSFSYNVLLEASAQYASLLLVDKSDLSEQHVCFMVNPGFDYVKTQWAIWRAGGVAVPLCLSHPLPSLQYVIEDTQASILVVSLEYETWLKKNKFGWLF
jgi:malonyl-CoA/methylmalonyl-CoA synthetase